MKIWIIQEENVILIIGIIPAPPADFKRFIGNSALLWDSCELGRQYMAYQVPPSSRCYSHTPVKTYEAYHRWSTMKAPINVQWKIQTSFVQVCRVRDMLAFDQTTGRVVCSRRNKANILAWLDLASSSPHWFSLLALEKDLHFWKSVIGSSCQSKSPVTTLPVPISELVREYEKSMRASTARCTK